MPLQRVRIKICGITDAEQAVAIAATGVDALGLVFHEGSSRCVSIARAKAVCSAIPAFVSRVGLFVDAPASAVSDAVRECCLSLLQFHGDERAGYCESFGLPYIKALRLPHNVTATQCAAMLEDTCNQHPEACGILVDVLSRHGPGGTGESFQWASLPARRSIPLILAGGLTPENVADGVARARPYAVDVSSGVESSPGHKDLARICAFVSEVGRSGSAP